MNGLRQRVTLKWLSLLKRTTTASTNITSTMIAYMRKNNLLLFLIITEEKCFYSNKHTASADALKKKTLGFIHMSRRKRVAAITDRKKISRVL